MKPNTWSHRSPPATAQPYEKESRSVSKATAVFLTASFIHCSFSFSKYKNTTVLIEIYTLVDLVHKKKAKYLQNYTVLRKNSVQKNI